MDPLEVADLPVGIIRLDRSDAIVEANAAFLAWAGVEAADAVGHRIEEFATFPAEDLYPEGRGPGPWMMVHRRNPERAVLVSRSPLPDGALLTTTEASERYAALVDLRHSYALADRTAARLGLVIDAAIAFSDATEESRLAEILADTAARAYGAEQSVVFLIDEHDGFHLAAGENPFAGMLDTPAVSGLALGMRDVMLVSGEDEARALSPLIARAMTETGVQAVLAAPVSHEDERPYGVFGCFFRHPRTFDAQAAPLADALASQAAQALANLRLRRRLAHAAMHDETTGLPNRRLLEQQLSEYATAWSANVAVIFLDLDDFKSVNDTLGHPAGDEVLRETGRRLQAAVREGDIVARYGGDEFVVVCEVVDEAAAEEIAERLRTGVEEPFVLAEGTLRLAASIGVSLTATRGQRLSTDRLVRAADQAMYLAKSRGGNRVVSETLARPA